MKRSLRTTPTKRTSTPIKRMTSKMMPKKRMITPRKVPARKQIVTPKETPIAKKPTTAPIIPSSSARVMYIVIAYYYMHFLW